MKKRFYWGYLYSNGTAAIAYEKEDKEAGHVSWVEVHEKWTEGKCQFTGFLRLDCMELLRMAKRAKRIEAYGPDVRNGSENTQKLGIAASSLTFSFGNGPWREDSLSITTFPGVISGPYKCFLDHTEIPGASSTCLWGHQITKFFPAKSTSPIPQKCAA